MVKSIQFLLQNCVFNKQYSKEEYEQYLKSFKRDSYKFIEYFKAQFDTFTSTLPNKFAHILNSENCIGDYINNSRECYMTFHASEAENCRYAEHVWSNSKNNMDVSTAGRNAEWIFESVNCGIDSYNISFSV
jgi:hypothetical protein